MAIQEEISHQLPSRLVRKEFGEVNVRPRGDLVEVTFTVAMLPQGEAAEGWQTGVALDASASMWPSFGHGLVEKMSAEALAEYRSRNAFTESTDDGRPYRHWRAWAVREGIERGHLKHTPNIVEVHARAFTHYLAANLDEDGHTTVLYWACGKDGSLIEEVGDFSAAECSDLRLPGPTRVEFGGGTRLVPAVNYFVERFRSAKRGMYVFLTDGRLDDLEAVKAVTRDLARQIEAGQRNQVKCVLVGVGSSVDRSQLEQLDDLDTGTPIDVWDHKVAEEMRDLVDIFAEVVDENQIVAGSARVYDAAGRLVADFSDGMPAKVTFPMSAKSAWFELELGGARIRQQVVP